MKSFDGTSFKVGMWIIGFLALAVTVNAISAHQWTLLKWALGLAAAATVALYCLCLPEKQAAQKKASGTVAMAGLAGLGGIVVLSLLWFDALLAVPLVAGVLVLGAWLASTNSMGFAMGKTFAVSLPTLFVVQLVVERFQMQAPF